MEHDALSRFLQDYLGRQPRLFGIDPQEALSRLSEVMQWPVQDEKNGRNEPAASGGIREKTGLRCAQAGNAQRR